MPRAIRVSKVAEYQLVTVDEGRKVADVLQLMEEAKTPFCVVLDANGNLRALLTKEQLEKGDREMAVRSAVVDMPLPIAVEKRTPLNETEAVKNVADQLDRSPLLPGVILVDDNKPISILLRKTVLDLAEALKATERGGYSPLAGDITPLPLPTYRCTYYSDCKFEWFRPEIGIPVPQCPKHHVSLMRV